MTRCCFRNAAQIQYRLITYPYRLSYHCLFALFVILLYDASSSLIYSAQWLDGLMSLNQLHSLYLAFNIMIIFLVKISILIPNVENG
jgi:hypothetical protein